MSNSNKLPDGVLVDDEDLERVLKLKWHINTIGYVVSDQRKTHKGKRDGKVVLLHRFILDFPDSQIDHKNQNRLDNRKENLRLATKAENMMNRGAPKHSKTGIKGVIWDNTRQKYRVYAKNNGKQYHIGFFDDIEEARTAYNERIESIQGEWAVKQ